MLIEPLLHKAGTRRGGGYDARPLIGGRQRTDLFLLPPGSAFQWEIQDSILVRCFAPDLIDIHWQEQDIRALFRVSGADDLREAGINIACFKPEALAAPMEMELCAGIRRLLKQGRIALME